MTPIGRGLVAVLVLGGGGLRAPELRPPEGEMQLPLLGCPMAHCDPSMSDRVYLPVPDGDVEQAWHRNELSSELAGSQLGLGCSGNGSFVACTYAGEIDNLVAYDYDGNRLWSSGSLLNNWAWTSAPLIDAEGCVVGCDTGRIVKLDGEGTLVWSTDLPAGTPGVSPVITTSGILVVATIGGPIYTVDHETGALLDVFYVRIDDDDEGLFSSRNTPAVRGDRVYVAMEHLIDGQLDEDELGWLAAIDVGSDPRGVLSVAWHYEFGAPSGASPLRIGRRLYFDIGKPAPGPGASDPHVIGLLDYEVLPIKLWEQPVGAPIVASFARDPRGGLWHYSRYGSWLVRRHLWTGDLLEAINVDDLLDEPDAYVPSSALTIAGSGAEPVLMLTASSQPANSLVLLAIDLNARALRWTFDVPVRGASTLTSGQFPILLGADGPRIVMSSSNSGARAIGAK